MKTTAGKTKTVPRTYRRFNMYVSGMCVGYVRAKKPREALLEFYKERLKPLGVEDVYVYGNVLSIAEGFVVTALEVRS